MSEWGLTLWRGVSGVGNMLKYGRRLACGMGEDVRQGRSRCEVIGAPRG